MRSRACLDGSEVPFGFQELFPSRCWTFGSKNEHKAGQLEAWKMVMLGEKSVRIRFRLGLAGHEVKSRAYLATSEVFFWAPRATTQLVAEIWKPK